MNSGNVTLAIIKPHAVKEGHTGKILSMIIDAGFKIRAMKLTYLTRENAERFYSIHTGKEFYERLLGCMTKGPIVVVLLEKTDAVNGFRKLLGATNPEKAEKGTLRKMFGTGQPENAVHGSDCVENAIIESDFFFSPKEVF